MTNIHSQSTSARVRSPEAVYEATRVLGLIGAMGLMKLPQPITLRLSLLREAANAAAQVGIGQRAAAVLASPQSNQTVVLLALRQLAEALEDSPLPVHETRELATLFGWDYLASLVQSSPVSLRRYASTLREAPDDVAGRLHWVAKVVGDLRGAYNDAGIRRWFDRPRVQLDGQAPIALLRQEWTPDQPEIAAIRSLANSLAGAGAA